MSQSQNEIDWELLSSLLNKQQVQPVVEPQPKVVNSIPLEQVDITNIFSLVQDGSRGVPNNMNSAPKVQTLSKEQQLEMYLQKLITSPQYEPESIDTQLYVRQRWGTFSVNLIGKEPHLFNSEKDLMAVSASGKKVIIGNTQVLILRYNQHQLAYQGSQIQLVEFSVDETFVFVVDKSESQVVLNILYSETLQQVSSCCMFRQVYQAQIGRFSKQQWPMVYMDSTNSLCFICLHHLREVHVLETANFSLVQRYINLPTPLSFSVSCARQSLYFSVVELRQPLSYPAPASTFQIWAYPNTTAPVYVEQLPGTQEVKQSWSNDGRVLLLWNQLLDDESNQSYYGVHQLYHITVEPWRMNEISKFEGPVHDLAWSPSRYHLSINECEYFVVISGFMPAGTVLYNRNGVKLYLINQHHVNAAYWSPNSEYLALCGFGNLPGEMEIWNVPQMKQIGRCKKDKVTLFQWSPENNYFLVATTFARLRVSNMYQIYSKEGQMLYEEEYQELYEVRWQPSLQEVRLADRPHQQFSMQTKKNTQTSFRKSSNFVKEMKGERDDLIYPIKLTADVNLADFAKQSQKVVVAEQPVALKQIAQQQQQKQVMMRRQTPIEPQQEELKDITSKFI